MKMKLSNILYTCTEDNWIPRWLSGKDLPAIQETQETWVQSLGQEDTLRGKWHPTLVFLLEKSHGQRSLEGYRPWGHKRVEPDLSTHEQRTILIPKLTKKYYNFTDMIPSLKILDFNSKGILQLYPLWNPIIIAGGGKKKRSRCQNWLVWWSAYLPIVSHLLLVDLVVEGTAKPTNQRKPHGNYCNPVRNGVAGGRQFYSTTTSILQLKENINMTRLRQVRHEQMFHIKWVEGPCWKLQALLRKAMTPIMEVLGVQEKEFVRDACVVEGGKAPHPGHNPRSWTQGFIQHSALGGGVKARSRRVYSSKSN